MKRHIILLISALFCALAVYGQSITVQAPNLVGEGEQFSVAFSIEGGGADNFQWSPTDDFNLVWGPSKSSSSSVNIINGKVTKSSQVTYSYILMPKSAGKFNLPAATAVVNGNSVASRSFTVEVVADGASSSAPAQSQGGTDDSSRTSSSGGDVTSSIDAFLSMSLNRTSVTVGEPVTATLKLYTRSNLAGCEDARFPAFNGFWSEEASAPSNLQFQREKVGDKIYDAAVIRRWTLTPRKEGDISIEPAELVCVFNVSNPSARTGSIFDSFFQDPVRQVRKRLVTPEKQVKVTPLPSGAPASFGGAVGDFKMDVRLTKDAIKTHEAASLVVTLSGSGNMAMITAPEVVLPPDFEAYDVKVSDGSGSKIFEYPFIPRSSGDFVIEPVLFSYYDLKSHSYKTLSGGEMPLSVAKGDNDGQSATPGDLSPAGVMQKDVRNLGTDIRYISTGDPTLVPSGSFFVSSVIYWIIIALIAVCGGAVWAALRSAAARRADVVATRGRGATKLARKRLSAAGGYLKSGLGTAFYEELHRALLGYVADRFNIEASDMTHENIRQKMTEHSVPDPVIAEFEKLLDACEFARYAPDSGTEAMNAHYESAVSVITTIDSCMKKKRRTSAVASAAVIVFAMGMGVRSFAASPCDSLWTAGCESYAAGSYAAAAESWIAIEDSGYESAELYYNIGNACFKDDRLALSILYYRRALQLDPSYDDAAFNLEFARSRCVDRLSDVPEFFLATWTRKFCYSLNSNVWAVLFAIFFAIMAASAVTFALSASSRLRKTGFFLALSSLLLSVLCLTFSLWQRNGYYAEDQAVVVKSVSPVKSSPGDDVSTNLFLLHEGTEVELMETVGDWNRISLSDGRQGWIKSSDIGVI